MMRDFDLRKLQLAELGILKEIDRVCKKYNIRYYLGWGSVLGAIRHKGFIPWDDDIDIVMEYDQYLLFKKACQADLSKDFYYQDCLDGSDYYLFYAKVRKNNTSSMTIKEAELKMHWGIGVDIFPLIQTNQNRMTKIMQLRRTYFQFLCQKKYKLASFQPESMKKKTFRFLYFFFSNESLMKKKEYMMKAFEWKADYKYLVDISDEKNIPVFKKDVFGEGIYVPFEDGLFPVPSQYDVYLKKVYGEDYMKIPNQEKRIDHGDILVIFDSDENKEYEIG